MRYQFYHVQVGFRGQLKTLVKSQDIHDTNTNTMGSVEGSAFKCLS